jgi:hypothetical protein
VTSTTRRHRASSCWTRSFSRSARRNSTVCSGMALVVRRSPADRSTTAQRRARCRRRQLYADVSCALCVCVGVLMDVLTVPTNLARREQVMTMPTMTMMLNWLQCIATQRCVTGRCWPANLRRAHTPTATAHVRSAAECIATHHIVKRNARWRWRRKLGAAQFAADVCRARRTARERFAHSVADTTKLSRRRCRRCPSAHRRRRTRTAAARPDCVCFMEIVSSHSPLPPASAIYNVRRVALSRATGARLVLLCHLTHCSVR